MTKIVIDDFDNAEVLIKSFDDLWVKNEEKIFFKNNFIDNQNMKYDDGKNKFPISVVINNNITEMFIFDLNIHNENIDNFCYSVYQFLNENDY